jgi:hypothetical protein
MKLFSDLIFVICFIIWLATSLITPINNAINDSTISNLLLVINTVYITFFIIIKLISDNNKKNKDLLSFKIGSTKNDKNK